MTTKFKTTIADIDCYCNVISYVPPTRGRTHGLIENCYPDDPGAFDFQLSRLDGEPSIELEHMITDEDEERIFEEFIAFVSEELS